MHTKRSGKLKTKKLKTVLFNNFCIFNFRICFANQTKTQMAAPLLRLIDVIALLVDYIAASKSA